MKKLLLFLSAGVFIFSILSVEAQTTRKKSERVDQETDYTQPEYSPIIARLDTLSAWYRRKLKASKMSAFNETPQVKSPEDTIFHYPPEVIKKRMKDLHSTIPLAYNKHVQAFIDLYTIRRREQVRRMLGLSHVYFPIYEDELDKAGLPMELKYLSVVESALNPHAKSPVGATGLWQFMYETGRLYNLKIDSYVDERKDPHKATRAAIRYFQDQYRVYKDWLLVIASFNCGPGNVRKAIIKSGGKTSFWEISPYLPRETRGYVPAFIAAMYVFNYHSAYNLKATPVEFSYFQDTLHINRARLSLQQIASVTHCDVALLKDLNPELKTDIIPFTTKPYVLRVPYKVSEFVTIHRDSLDRVLVRLTDKSRDRSLDNELSLPGSPEVSQPVATKVEQPAPDEKLKLITYTVRKGDKLNRIASRYNVSPESIAEWNRLNKNRITVGQRLKIYIPNRFAGGKPKSIEKAGQKYYQVRPGDTLWSIAKKYDGLTVDKLMTLNNLSEKADLKGGQMLLIE